MSVPPPIEPKVLGMIFGHPLMATLGRQRHVYKGVRGCHGGVARGNPVRGLFQCYLSDASEMATWGVFRRDICYIVER